METKDFTVISNVSPEFHNQLIDAGFRQGDNFGKIGGGVLWYTMEMENEDSKCELIYTTLEERYSATFEYKLTSISMDMEFGKQIPAKMVVDMVCDMLQSTQMNCKKYDR